MFEPVNDLEKSLMRATTNASARPQFLRDLLATDIFALHQKGDNLQIQDNVVQKGSKLNLLSFEKDGRSWLPIFTSLQRVEQYIRSESRYIQLKSRDFFEITRGAFVFLNPGFPYGKEFFPQEIDQMLDGSIFKPTQTYTAQQNTQVMIGQPAVYPQQLVKTLSSYFKKNPLVSRAYLTQYYNPAVDQASHLLIAIEGKGDWQKILGDAGMIASEVIGKGEVIDFMRLDNNVLSKSIMNQSQPFYSKKSFLEKLFG